MATRAMVGFTPPNSLDLIVEGLDPQLVGREALVEVAHEVTVHDSRPVHGREVLWSQTVTLDSTDLLLPITLPSPILYAWDGPMVTADVVVRLKFPKSGWFSKDQILAEAVAALPRVAKEREPTDPVLVGPRDTWQIEPVIQSLGPAARARVATQLSVYVAGSVAGFVFAVWSSWCLLYFVWLVGVAIGGVYVFGKVSSELSEYASLEFQFVPPLGPDVSVPLSQLLHGSPRVDVVRPRLRIVAYNLERGKYRRGSGTDVRTVSFAEPIGAVALYDREVDRWPTGVPLAEVFDGDVDFGPAFRALAPPLTVDEAYGVGLRWEAQLVVPDLVDVELEGPVEVWHWPADWSPES